MEFEKRYQSLNAAQREAVDCIEGPVMVVAGPGTGKTELLSVRVANILKVTDALPQNILCLTFTDSGAVAMRERLGNLLGPEAYKIAVHTFHSFGSEIINQYAQYFYSGAHFRPSDELGSYEVLTSLLKKLPHDNPLSSKLNDEFTYLRDIQSTISELKRGGLTPDELDEILRHNEDFIDWLRPKLTTVFADRLSKKTLAAAQMLLDEIALYNEKPLKLTSYHPLSQLIQSSLARAIDESNADNTTKPLTAWKNLYLEKDAHAAPVLKDEKRGQKLRALSSFYFDYLIDMQAAELYDYDDMILRVVHALEIFPELRFSLQEQYQYILVDEFQDTNDAQMRLVWNLTNNPASEGRPNLMVVGDDDQAIYRFQGAELSNIIDFRERYRNVTVVTLTDNYRSTASILDLSRSVITQASERLEHVIENLSKTLVPHHSTANSVTQAFSYEVPDQAHAALVAQIASDALARPKETRAVIARHHRELIALLPHFAAAGLNVRYERQENILDSESVKQLELVAHVVWHIGEQDFNAVNEHLAELLAHPAWDISPKSVWELSLTAHREKKYWLEVMLNSDNQLKNIAEWLIVASARAKTEPLEYMLDYLFGVRGDEDKTFVLPYKNYFFPSIEKLDNLYLAHLAALKKLRSSLRDYKPEKVLQLGDFVEYLSLCRSLGLHIVATGVVETEDYCVTLLSAHKAKGLEFDAVYLTDVTEPVWGSSARARSRLLSFPSNIALSPAGDGDDERLRLLYVALTRARQQLTLFAARTSEQGKTLLPAGAFSSGNITFEECAEFPVKLAIQAAETSWYTPLLNLPQTDQKTLLAPLLENYRLSATHLNNFLNVTKGGPDYFLLHNLLRLPEAMPPSAIYGSAIHAVLQRTHQHLSATKKKRPVEDVIHDFETTLGRGQLSEVDRTNFSARGTKALSAFLEQRYDSFTRGQLVERSFSGEHVVIGDAVITGALDLVDIDHDEKTIFVTDYKTGKAATSWQGRDEFQKIKLHQYEQQLMFYKLLIENSRQFGGYTVTGGRIEFVEPDARGQIVLLDYAYDRTKMQTFERLVSAVWKHILSLDLPSVADYPSTLRGIQQFEDDLLT